MKNRSLKIKWCLMFVLCLSLFTPALAMAQWGGSYWGGSDWYEYVESYSYSDCYCGGGGRGGWGGYLPSIGGCNYSPINYDD